MVGSTSNDRNCRIGWAASNCNQLFRRNSGNWRAPGCIPAIAQDTEKVEALATSIKWAVEYRVLNLHLEGDCVNVVSVINGRMGSTKCATNNIIYDCLEPLK
ncbi:hypothetical protein C5167_011795 [Papaver somniferum]|nr:hypothetical protein C5167_011795 [Papaver somniferum]